MVTSPPTLSEKDFINEGYSKNPFPLWLWFFLLTILIALIWGGTNWYGGKLNTLFSASPFLRVTNREMSLFLWQNPEFMRVNSKEKQAYLPAFNYRDKVTLDPSQAEDYAIAPPEILFRYHTWKRLVSNEFTQRAIPKNEFLKFLSEIGEWAPSNWPDAPSEYVQTVKNLDSNSVENLVELSQKQLPQVVRMAFQGWKNYFIDGEAINQITITIDQVNQFLKENPHFARNFWRNIVVDQVPNYLKNLKNNESKALNDNEITPFLRVAIYNFFAAREETSLKTQIIP